LQPGDLVITYRGEPVTSRRELLFRVAGTEPGTAAEMEVERGGERLRLVVRPVEWQDKNDGEAAGPGPWLGLEVAALDGPDPRVARLRETLGITATKGLVAVVVQEDGPAADAGIRPGDVLVALEDVELADRDAWAQARALYGASGRALTVLVRTGSTESYVTVTPRAEGLEN
jgi:serine protease Do